MIRLSKTQITKLLLVMAILFAVTFSLPISKILSAQTSQQTCIQGAEIPAGFDFPANQNTLMQLIAKQDWPALRRHAWMVFAGLSQPAREGGDCLVWETWYDKAQTYTLNPSATRSKLSQRITKPRQLDSARMLDNLGLKPGQSPKELKHPNGQAILASVIYNKVAYDYIRDNKLYLLSTLAGMQGSIKEFPRPAVVVKPTWWPVAKSGYTPLPVWDNDPANPLLQYNGYETWKRLVAIDPTPSSTEKTVSVTFPNNNKDYPAKTSDANVVSLNRFYYYKLTAEDIAGIGPDDAIAKSATEVLNRSLQEGDYIAFLGMHYATKEITNWVWATFWWHDQANTNNPNRSVARYAEDRPPAIKGVWLNYLMDTSYDMVNPKESNGSAAVCINPYDELQINMPGTILTNCTTCHVRAAYPSFINTETNGSADTKKRSNVAIYDTLRRGYIPSNDPIFRNLVKVDTLWSISDNAIPDKQ